MIRIYSDYNTLLGKEIKQNKEMHNYHSGKSFPGYQQDQLENNGC